MCDGCPRGEALVPNLEEAVPRAGADCHSVFRHAKAAHTIVVAGKNAWKKKRGKKIKFVKKTNKFLAVGKFQKINVQIGKVYTPALSARIESQTLQLKSS